LFVNAFLYQITQDTRGRQSGWSELRDSDGRVVGRQPAAQYFRLVYLITAWASGQGGASADTERVLAEHELLGFVLDACAQHGVLPDDCVEGALAESGAKTVLEFCTADSSLATSGTWAGLGIAPRAHVELVLVAPARPPVLTDLAPPAREIVLNAAQEQPASAAATADRRTAVPQTTERPFGTLRRWERQTVNEPARRNLRDHSPASDRESPPAPDAARKPE
jgi:hypothetical protein